jgi:FkbM family methyltransferase
MIEMRGKGRFAVAMLVLAVAVASTAFGITVGRRYEFNVLCCDVPGSRNVALSLREALGLASYPSQIGQDKWVTETVFPGKRDGYFLDVGSGDGVTHSNTWVLEQRGWNGICVDPFPTNVDDRRCRMFKEVVYSRAGDRVKFHTAGELAGIADTLDTWKPIAEQSPVVEFTTTTLGGILERAKAPRHIDYMSLDIEGAELEALRGLPLDRYTFGAMTIEHNYEGRKRNDIQAFLEARGYRRVRTWRHDDFYLSTDVIASLR